jgi:hypothetical protein
MFPFSLAVLAYVGLVSADGDDRLDIPVSSFFDTSPAFPYQLASEHVGDTGTCTVADGVSRCIISAPGSSTSNDGVGLFNMVTFSSASQGEYTATVTPLDLADVTPERSDVLPNTASQTVTQIFEVGDVDGDGVGDLGVVTGLRGTWEASTPNTAWGIFPGEAGNSFGSQPVDVGLGDFPFSQGVGDVNGDGYADSVVAVSRYAAGVDDSYVGLAKGIVEIRFGSAAGVAADPDMYLLPPTTTLSFAAQILIPGDVNGDGFDDIIVSDAHQPDTTGVVYLYLGSATGDFSTEPHQTLVGPAGSDAFGGALMSTGDVDGDGKADILVGHGDVSQYGGVTITTFEVFLGTEAGLAETSSGSLETDGWDVFDIHAFGDVNGDGRNDALVSQRTSDFSVSIGVYWGTASGALNETAHGEIPWPEELYDGIRVVAYVGDVNDDTFGDVVACSDDSFEVGGACYVLLGSASGGAFDATPFMKGTEKQDGFGSYAGPELRDSNKDGYADFVVCASEMPAAGDIEHEGRFLVLRGGEDGLNVDEPVSLGAGEVDLTASYRGLPFFAGDLNGDEVEDIVVRCYTCSSVAFLVYHGGGDPLSYPSAPSLTIPSGAFSSVSLGAARTGDVDGDGVDDLLVAVGGASPALILFRGSPTGLDAAGGISITLAGDVEVPGIAVSPSADTNDDGYADILVGGGDDGTVLLIFGQEDVEEPFTARSFSNSTADSFGKVASFIGDVNGDGHVDLMITAPKEGEKSPGWMYVYSGSSDGPLVDQVTVFESGSRYSEAGGEVVALGDVNEDGYDDVLVRFDRRREVLLALGSATGLSLDKTSYVDPRSDGKNGISFVQAPAKVHLAGGGDINGDGIPDFLFTLVDFDTAVGVYGSSVLGGQDEEEATPSPDSPSTPSPPSSTTTTSSSETGTPISSQNDDDDVSPESTTTTSTSLGGDLESTVGTDSGEDEGSLPLPLLIGGAAVALLLLSLSLVVLLRRRAAGRLQRRGASVELSSGRHSTRSRSASHSTRIEA